MQIIGMRAIQIWHNNTLNYSSQLIYQSLSDYMAARQIDFVNFYVEYIYTFAAQSQ